MSAMSQVLSGNMKKIVSLQTVRTFYNANKGFVSTIPCYAAKTEKLNPVSKSANDEKKIMKKRSVDSYERFEKMDQHFEVNVTTPNQLRSVHVTFY